jgi:hypothetical protein
VHFKVWHEAYVSYIIRHDVQEIERGSPMSGERLCMEIAFVFLLKIKCRPSSMCGTAQDITEIYLPAKYMVNDYFVLLNNIFG